MRGFWILDLSEPNIFGQLHPNFESNLQMVVLHNIMSALYDNEKSI